MIKINLKSFIICFSFILMCFSVFFLRWYINSNLIAYVALFSTSLLLILDPKKNGLSRKSILLAMLYILYVIVNYCFTPEHQYFFDDLILHTLFSISILIFFTKFFVKEKYSINSKYIVLFLCNLYYIINNFIIMKQITIKGFMVRNFSSNTFYLDQIDGLFGTNGTHKLCFFFLICLFFNLLYIKDKNKFVSISSKIMFVYIFITSIYVSVYNDNRFYFFALALIFILPVIIKNFNFVELKKMKKIMTIFVLIFISVFSFTVLYFSNESFKIFMDDKIYEKYILKTITRINNTRTASSQKGEERIELTMYAIRNANGLFLGKGIGSILTYSDPRLPKHFGLNDISLRIYTGGVIYFLLLILIYYENYISLVKNKNKYIKLYIFFIILFLTVYSRVFANCDETFLMTIMFLLFVKYIDNNNLKTIK